MKAVIAWTLCLLLLAGCGRPGDGKPAVALVTNSASDFWTIARKGAQKAAAEMGVELDFRVPQPPDAAAQQRLLEDLLTRGVDGVAISPKDPANQIGMLDRVAEKVPLLTVDSDAPGASRLAYVGTDNLEAGRAAGRRLLEALPGGGEVVLFVGDLEARNARRRRQGVLEVLEGTGLRVVGTRTDGTDRVRARANVEEVLVNRPEIAGLVGLWSYNGPQILAAVKDLERTDPERAGRIAIVCFDEEPDTLAGVAEGRIHATVVQRPFQMGYHSVRILAGLVAGEEDVLPEGGHLDTGIRVITKENVKGFQEELEARLR